MSSFPACRLIRKNEAETMPRCMVFLDTETKKVREGYSELHRLKLAWACYVERRPGRAHPTEVWQDFKGTWPLNKWLAEHAPPKRPLYLFGHNIFFDLQASDFFYYFPAQGWTLDFIYDKGLTYLLVIRKGNRCIKVVSTTNFFDTSLAELGKVIGLPKQEVDFEEASDAVLSEYCHRDVEITKLAVERLFEFIKSNDLAKFSMTRSSQAFHAYRHRFMTAKIYPHHHEPTQELEQLAYIGGRVECFEIGKIRGGPFVTLDVNAMYPYVMRKYDHPAKLIGYYESIEPARLRESLLKYQAIAEVDLETETPLFAVRRDNKIIFPVGRFKAFLCTLGLDTAFKRGMIRATYRAAIYKPDDLFTAFVEDLHALRYKYRDEGNLTYELMIKKMMNSLYGKFAQFVPIQSEEASTSGEPYYRLETKDLVTGEKEIEYKLFNKVVRVTGKEVGKQSFIAISAHITEQARFELWEIMEQICLDRVLYCDTDSVKIRKSDLPRVTRQIDDRILGALKVEKETKRLELRGCKSYITETDRVIKGIPKKAVLVARNTYEFLSFPGQVTHMTDKETRAFRAKWTRRENRVFYDKGVVHRNGKVSPIVLSEF